MPKYFVLDPIFETAFLAVEQTSGVLLRPWRPHRARQYDTKLDSTPVTRVDHAVERRIRKIIKARHPDHMILGEEGGNETGSQSPWLWVIDPIDGTKSYIRGLPYFGTQLAVLYEGEVVVGVSSAPALGEIVVAQRGAGAFLNEKRLRVSSIRSLNRSLIVHGILPLFDQQGLLTGLRRLCNEAWGIQGFQDFWSYHLLAAGSIDASIEAKTNIWDIAAASLIVKEAGGTVTDVRGRPIGPTTTSCVATNGWIHSAILDMLR